MRGIIRVGDVHSHGGRVETGALSRGVMGRAVARRGDRCTCPLHGEVVIADGEADFDVDGAPVPFDGHKTSCGGDADFVDYRIGVRVASDRVSGTAKRRDSLMRDFSCAAELLQHSARALLNKPRACHSIPVNYEMNHWMRV